MADAHKNFAYSTVATAPSPAASGTSLVVAAGHGSRFPATPFNATIWPANALATPANAEIVRVTAISTDTLTITRTQEGSSARTVVVGDQIAATITAKSLEDIETGKLDVPGAWSTYTPTIAADGGGLALGSGSTQSGRYIQLGKLVIVQVKIQFGTSGVNPGSGYYRIGLPVLVHASQLALAGHAELIDSSTATRRMASVAVSGSADNAVLFVDSATDFVTHANPWTWAASDTIAFQAIYEAE